MDNKKSSYFFIILVTITISGLYFQKFDLSAVLVVCDEYLKIILTSWPAIILILGGVTLTRHHGAIDHFIKNRMTEVGPGGLKGGMQIKQATKEEIEDKTIVETFKDEQDEIRIQKNTANIEVETGITRPVPNTDKEHVINRFKKNIEIEQIVQSKLVEKYQDRYKSQVRISNGDKKIIVDGLIYSKANHIHSAVEIKFVTSKSFEAVKFIISRKLRQLWTLGIKRLNLVLVSESFSTEEVLKLYYDNLHQAQIFFYVWDGEKLKEVEIPTRSDHIL